MTNWGILEVALFGSFYSISYTNYFAYIRRKILYRPITLEREPPGMFIYEQIHATLRTITY